jgi:hypothetical protein
LAHQSAESTRNSHQPAAFCPATRRDSMKPGLPFDGARGPHRLRQLPPRRRRSRGDRLTIAGRSTAGVSLTARSFTAPYVFLGWPSVGADAPLGQNREDGEKPSRSRHCERGAFGRMPLCQAGMGRRRGRRSASQETCPSELGRCSPRQGVCPLRSPRVRPGRGNVRAGFMGSGSVPQNLSHNGAQPDLT